MNLTSPETPVANAEAELEEEGEVGAGLKSFH